MALFAELLDTTGDFFDPTADAESDPDAFGEYTRPGISVPEAVGARAIQKIQPELERSSLSGKVKMVGQFFNNLLDNVGEFAMGTFAMGAYPIMHPKKFGGALLTPIDTASMVTKAVVDNYKESYTPKEGESVPGMILRRFYEKPFDSLMDVSMVGQIAMGGAGALTRGLTAGVRGAAQGTAAAAALTESAGFAGGAAEAARAIAEAGGALTPEVAAMQRAAAATRTIDLFGAAAERARRLDPMNIALDAGLPILKTKAADMWAEMKTIASVTDDMADRTAQLRAAEDAMKQQTEAAFSELNTTERNLIHPYIAGRLNLDRPVGEQLMTHTGEWVPVKGDVVRPDVMERARQAYLPIQKQFEKLQGFDPEDVKLYAGKNALNEAEKILGDEFDPMSAEVQEFVDSEVAKALEQNAETLKARATGEMRTSLDIAKEREWRTKINEMVASNAYASEKAAMSALPRPERVTPEEALRLMGPQGGSYFPHSAETFNRDQSTIKNYLTKLREAKPWKENKYHLYAAGVMENKDPVKAILRAHAAYNKGNTWQQMMYEAMEKSVEEGTGAERKAFKTWDWVTDPDVIKGTHQPFHPAMILTDDLIEDEGQRMLTRLLEVGDDSLEASGVNFSDVMSKLIEQSEKGPIFKMKKDFPLYKIPTAMGHGIASVREAMQPTTNPLVRKLDNMTQWWNWTNLNLKLTRAVNNIVGNTFFAAIQGVHPFSVRGVSALVATGRAVGAQLGVLKDAESRRLAEVFNLPGIRSGGFQLSLEQATGNVGEKLMTSKFLPAKAIGYWGDTLARVNSAVESAYRAASLYYEMSPGGLQRLQKAVGHGIESMSLGEKIEQFAKAGGEVTMKNPEYRAALRQVNRYFNNYDRTTPFERMMVRRIFPYYKFFKHSTDLITKFPFEHPLKGQVARALGKAAMTDVKDTLKQWGMDWDRDVPESMRDSLPMRRDTDPETGKPIIWMYNTKGANPFSQMNGYLSEQALQLLNPVVKIVIEQATGVNLFTRERYRGAISSYTGREVDKRTGQITDSFNHPSFGEAVLRSFWPYQAAREFVAQGRMPTDTASLLDLVTNAPNAWQYDAQKGFPQRRPQYFGAKTAFTRFVGPAPQPLEPRTKKQKTTARATVNSQLRTLMQRYPARREDIRRAIEAAGEEVYSETE